MAERRDPMIAALKASRRVRDGQWLRGAPTHVLAEFLTALGEDGWVLRYEPPVCKECGGRGWRTVVTSGRRDRADPESGWGQVTTVDCAYCGTERETSFIEAPRGTYENPRSNECSHGQRWGCPVCDPTTAPTAAPAKGQARA